MRYTPISSNLFKKNREKFISGLRNNALAVFNSNDTMPTSADGTMPFVQQSDIYYLSGIDQEESILVLSPNAMNPNHREVLFLKETSEHIAVWEGAKLTKEQARERSGIQTVYWLSEFSTIFKDLMRHAERVYLNLNEHYRASVETETRDKRFFKYCKEHYPLHTYERSFPILNRIRTIKEAEEIEAMQTACNITEKGFRRLLSFIKPGVWEYEIEAELIHEFICNRSKGFAYTPIIASGANACVLHYTENNKICRDGDLILLDVAAEYANYKSDLTRCVPANGRFSPRQKQVYNAVLYVMRKAMTLLKPQYTVAQYHQQVCKIMEEQLIKLGLFTAADVKNQDPKNPLFRKYYMHGTSHFLGLDVHDYGGLEMGIKPGMVFTIEPGIYIAEEGLGIRIENNFLVTENGLIDLMANIPIEVEEIEDLMNTGK
ncbi:MAG: aminopeptidase P family protein [Cytophagales bacterium]|nr:MAG: aminopeptidase P family protein [Cytophagales bacterium]TAF59509.1 MAG: aminopeptidase P family protein [Cytophagales bacterium]